MYRKTEEIEIVVTGGNSGGKATCKTESYNFNTRSWSPFTDLPFKMVHHAQQDVGTTRLYGGMMSGLQRKMIMQYFDGDWDLVNVTMPNDLEYHHATRYPAYLVGC